MTTRITLILTALFYCTTTTSGQRTSWPMLNGDAMHTSNATIEIEFPLKVAVEFDLGFNGEDGMAITEDYLFIQESSDSNILIAADLHTGDSLWQFGVPGSGGSANFTPAVADGIVLTSGQSAAGVWGLDVVTGAVEWFRPVGALYTRCPAITDGLVILATHDSLVCLELVTGNLIWSFPGFMPQISPVADDTAVFFGSGGMVYSLDKFSGGVNWMQPVPNGTFSSYALDADRLYVSQYRTEINALDKSDGTVLWTVTLDTNETMIDYPGAFAQTDEFLVVKFFIDENQRSQYLILDKSTGAEISRFAGNWMFYGQHTIINDYIVDFVNGTMLFLDIPSGDTAYMMTIPTNGTTFQVVAANNRIYIGAGGLG